MMERKKNRACYWYGDEPQITDVSEYSRAKKTKAKQLMDKEKRVVGKMQWKTGPVTYMQRKGGEGRGKKEDNGYVEPLNAAKIK